jgi:hypothetical protein
MLKEHFILFFLAVDPPLFSLVHAKGFKMLMKTKNAGQACV